MAPHLAHERAPRYIRRMGQIGRTLLVLGVVIAGAGLLLMLGERFGLGKLPGDIIWRRKGTTVYVPIVTSLVISVVLTLLLNILFRRK
jgi:hypothetical protein